MLSLHKLELFVYVAQAGSISKAADHFLMSQPNISQHIQDLEVELGEKLLVRKQRGVALTPAGETLLAYAQEVFRLLAEARLALTNVSRLDRGSLALAATPGVGIYLLPEWVECFRGRYPQFVVSIKTGITSEVADWLSAQQCEVGFVEGELDQISLPADFGVLVLDNVQQFVVVGASHPWASCSGLSIYDLNDQQALLRQPGSRSRVWLDRMLRINGVRLRCVGELDNPEAIKRALLAGNAFAVLPAYVVRREVEQGALRLIPVVDCSLHRQLKLLWRKEWPLSPLLYVFLQQLSGEYPVIQSVLSSSRGLQFGPRALRQQRQVGRVE